MPTVPTSTARPVTLPQGATVRASDRDRLKHAINRRAGRIEGILLVVVMLLPQLIIVLLGVIDLPVRSVGRAVTAV